MVSNAWTANLHNKPESYNTVGNISWFHKKVTYYSANTNLCERNLLDSFTLTSNMKRSPIICLLPGHSVQICVLISLFITHSMDKILQNERKFTNRMKAKFKSYKTEYSYILE